MEVRNVLRYFIFVSFCLVVVKTTYSAPPLEWETNLRESPFASPYAKRGGVLKTYLPNFPLTFRLYGPNSNGYFARWNRMSCNFSLVALHPITHKHIPMLAKEWSISKDFKTVYYKLDPRVRWSDGEKVTADDYVFAYKTALNKYLRDPFLRKYYSERIAEVKKIDEYTIKIVGKYASWRILSELNISPLPKHAMSVDKNWIVRENWKAPICVGPYVIDKYKRGRYVRFKRLAQWWGEKHRYLKGLYNFDYIDIKTIRDHNIAFEYFKKGKLSYYTVLRAVMWHKELDFYRLQQGFIKKAFVKTSAPEPKFGIAFNVKKPIVSNKYFRKAVASLFDFNKLNKSLMYGDYKRINSFWGGTDYENKKVRAYAFDPKQAMVYLKKAGYTQRDKLGYWIDKDARRASFTLKYASQSLARVLDIFKEDLKKYGIEMSLQLLDPAKAFKDELDKNFQAIIFSRTAGFYPAPEQYLHSYYADKKNNNNVFAYANKTVDHLIKVYQTELNFSKRKKAMNELENIIHDEAIYLPFWTLGGLRLLYDASLDSIDGLEPKSSLSFNDYGTWFYK